MPDTAAGTARSPIGAFGPTRAVPPPASIRQPSPSAQPSSRITRAPGATSIRTPRATCTRPRTSTRRRSLSSALLTARTFAHRPADGGPPSGRARLRALARPTDRHALMARDLELEPVARRDDLGVLDP